MIICIDAGHGGRDSGAVNGSRYEKNDTLKLANLVKAALNKKGVKVIMTRTDDSYVSLKERSDFANNGKADYFISLHRNAFTDITANGLENWIYEATNSKTEAYAKAVFDEVLKIGGFASRGVKRGNFHVTRETKMPACLLELGFISNLQDNLVFDRNLTKNAEAIAGAIASYAGIKEPPINPPIPPSIPELPLYRVQVGAFAQRENAEKTAKELAEKGYSSIILNTN